MRIARATDVVLRSDKSNKRKMLLNVRAIPVAMVLFYAVYSITTLHLFYKIDSDESLTAPPTIKDLTDDPLLPLHIPKRRNGSSGSGSGSGSRKHLVRAADGTIIVQEDTMESTTSSSEAVDESSFSNEIPSPDGDLSSPENVELSPDSTLVTTSKKGQHFSIRVQEYVMENHHRHKDKNSKDKHHHETQDAQPDPDPPSSHKHVYKSSDYPTKPVSPYELRTNRTLPGWAVKPFWFWRNIRRKHSVCFVHVGKTAGVSISCCWH